MHYVDELLKMIFLKQFGGSVRFWVGPLGSFSFVSSVRFGLSVSRNVHVLTVGVRMTNVTKA